METNEVSASMDYLPSFSHAQSDMHVVRKAVSSVLDLICCALGLSGENPSGFF